MWIKNKSRWKKDSIQILHYKIYKQLNSPFKKNKLVHIFVQGFTRVYLWFNFILPWGKWPHQTEYQVGQKNHSSSFFLSLFEKIRDTLLLYHFPLCLVFPDFKCPFSFIINIPGSRFPNACLIFHTLGFNKAHARRPLEKFVCDEVHTVPSTSAPRTCLPVAA